MIETLFLKMIHVACLVQVVENVDETVHKSLLEVDKVVFGI